MPARTSANSREQTVLPYSPTHPAARIIARIPALIGLGRNGQAATNWLRSLSVILFRAASEPDSAPSTIESAVFPRFSGSVRILSSPFCRLLGFEPYRAPPMDFVAAHEKRSAQSVAGGAAFLAWLRFAVGRTLFLGPAASNNCSPRSSPRPRGICRCWNPSPRLRFLLHCPTRLRRLPFAHPVAFGGGWGLLGVCCWLW